MLDDMSTAAPDKLTLTRLNEKADNLEIEGIAVSNTVISEYLRALDASAYFESVFLKDIEALPPDKSNPVTLKKFKLTARLSVVKPAGDKAAEASGAPVAKPTDTPATAPGAPATAPAAPAAAPAAPAATPSPAGGGA
jgi:Tfp pilus assembly protein PilN